MLQLIVKARIWQAKPNLLDKPRNKGWSGFFSAPVLNRQWQQKNVKQNLKNLHLLHGIPKLSSSYLYTGWPVVIIAKRFLAAQKMFLF